MTSAADRATPASLRRSPAWSGSWPTARLETCPRSGPRPVRPGRRGRAPGRLRRSRPTVARGSGRRRPSAPVAATRTPRRCRAFPRPERPPGSSDRWRRGRPPASFLTLSGLRSACPVRPRPLASPEPVPLSARPGTSAETTPPPPDETPRADPEHPSHAVDRGHLPQPQSIRTDVRPSPDTPAAM